MQSYNPDTYQQNPQYRWYWGMNHLYRVSAVCIDGNVRRATITGEADTFFSAPARVSVRGYTVTGWITCDRNANNDEVYSFIANASGRNGWRIGTGIPEV